MSIYNEDTLNSRQQIVKGFQQEEKHWNNGVRNISECDSIKYVFYNLEGSTGKQHSVSSCLLSPVTTTGNNNKTHSQTVSEMIRARGDSLCKRKCWSLSLSLSSIARVVCWRNRGECTLVAVGGRGERRAGEATVITFISPSTPQDGVAIRARNHDWLPPPS